MYSEIQPEMQPAFEFPATYTQKNHDSDFLTLIDWALGRGFNIPRNVTLIAFESPGWEPPFP